MSAFMRKIVVRTTRIRYQTASEPTGEIVLTLPGRTALELLANLHISADASPIKDDEDVEIEFVLS